MIAAMAMCVEHWVNCYYCFNWAHNIVLNGLQPRNNTLDSVHLYHSFNGKILISSFIYLLIDK